MSVDYASFPFYERLLSFILFCYLCSAKSDKHYRNNHGRRSWAQISLFLFPTTKAWQAWWIVWHFQSLRDDPSNSNTDSTWHGRCRRFSLFPMYSLIFLPHADDDLSRLSRTRQCCGNGTLYTWIADMNDKYIQHFMKMLQTKQDQLPPSLCPSLALRFSEILLQADADCPVFFSNINRSAIP
jgi:hypothetical protein